MKKAIKKLQIVLLVFALLIPVVQAGFINASAAERRTVIHTWISDSAMGECPSYAVNGFRYYLCYEIYDANTGTKYNNYRGGNYDVTMTFYKPNGSVAFSYTYGNSDNNWISHVFNTTGVYKGRITVKGAINGSSEVRVSSANAKLQVHSWASKTKMGSACEYYDKGGSCYYCYKLYDANTGVTLDKLFPSKNYTVTQSFCDTSGKVKYTTTKHKDSSYYGLTNLRGRQSFILKLQISGDFSASVQTPVHVKYYTEGETYSFCNSYTDFLGSKNATGRYYINDSEFNTLLNYVYAWYSYSPSLAYNNAAKMRAERDSAWGGSCYGMSITTMLDKNNQIRMNENFGTNSYGSASSMNKIGIPFNNRAARSAINYYQIAQGLSFAVSEKTYKKSSSKWSSGLRELVNSVKNNNLVLFSFFWYSDSDKRDVGHSIILQYTYVDGNGNNKILAYDPNRPGGTTVITIDKNFTTCSIDGYTSNPKSIEISTNLSNMNRIDIDGSGYTYRSAEDTYQSAEGTYQATNSTDVAYISFDLTGDVKIINEEGKTLYYNTDLDYSGTMDVLSEKLIINGADSPMSVLLEVKNSKSFTFESESDELNVSVTSERIFASADTKDSDSVIIAEDEGMYVLGSDFDCSAYMTYNNKGDMISYSADSFDNDLILQSSAGGITVFGKSDTGKVTLFEGDSQQTYYVKPEYSSFVISCDSDSDFITFAGSDDDINYDLKMDINEPVPVEAIDIPESELSITMGESKKLTGTVAPETATDKTVIWASSDESIVTVDPDGTVNAIAVGSATVYAISADETVSDMCNITVTAPPVSGIETDISEAELSVGETAVINAQVKPEEALNKNIRFSSLDTAVATVSEDGTITAVAPGTTTVEAYTEEGNFRAEIKVNVKPVEVSGIMTESSDIYIEHGKTRSLSVTVLPVNAANRNVSWSTSDESIVSVDRNGVITARKAGAAKVIAKTEEGGFETEFDINVTPTAVQSIEIVPPEKNTLTKGEEMQLQLSSTPSDTDISDIQWQSSNQDVVSVDNNGKLIAVNEGAATITATTADGRLSASYDIFVTADDTQPSACSCICHSNGFTGFIWKIYSFFYRIFSINPVCRCGALHY